MAHIARLLFLFLVAQPVMGCSDDDGGQDNNNNDVSPLCGNGVVDDAEECDEGGANSDRIANACRTDCRLPHCGDGVVDPEEQCDVGETGDAGCSATCQVASGWQCVGTPSTCSCAAGYQGSGCASCVRFVDRDAAVSQGDGLTWETAYRQVQPALDSAAEAGGACEVWVARGVYSAFRSSAFDTLELRSGVGLYGGFVGDETARVQRDPRQQVTILSGHWPEELPFASVYHVVSAAQTVDATLDGFIIYGGSAQGTELDGRGGGLSILGGELTVRDVVFFHNGAGEDGGGLSALDARVVVDRCVFSANSARNGGAAVSFNSTLEIRDSIFAGNYASEQAGGLVVASLGSGDTIVSNVVFTGNLGVDDAAAIMSANATTRFTNVTVAGNTTQNGTLAWNQTGGDLTIVNSIVWDNTGGGLTTSGNAAVSHSANQDWLPAGVGNINQDPQWVTLVPVSGTFTERTFDLATYTTVLTDPTATWTPGELMGRYVNPDTNNSERRYLIVDNTETTLSIWADFRRIACINPMGCYNAYTLHDLRLQATSPCIDTGDDSAPERLTTDLDGLPRVDWYDGPTDIGVPGTETDMGAYEFQGN